MWLTLCNIAMENCDTLIKSPDLTPPFRVYSKIQTIQMDYIH